MQDELDRLRQSAQNDLATIRQLRARLDRVFEEKRRWRKRADNYRAEIIRLREALQLLGSEESYGIQRWQILDIVTKALDHHKGGAQ